VQSTSVASETVFCVRTFGSGPGKWRREQAALLGNGVAQETLENGDERKAVLLVEDDLDVREAVAMILTEEGFHVVAASDGARALDLLAKGQHQFCTVILDVLMPGVDGVEFLNRGRQWLGSTPVLLFSASPLSGALRDDPQVKDLIPKPVEVEVLLAKIRAHCG
jgi:CheY-like chemotaxis protein